MTWREAETLGHRAAILCTVILNHRNPIGRDFQIYTPADTDTYNTEEIYIYSREDESLIRFASASERAATLIKWAARPRGTLIE